MSAVAVVVLFMKGATREPPAVDNRAAPSVRPGALPPAA